MLRSEWENWLEDENKRCGQVGAALEELSSEKSDSIKGALAQKVLAGRGTNDTKRQQTERVENLRHWYEEYCGSCKVDHDALVHQRDTLSMTSI